MKPRFLKRSSYQSVTLSILFLILLSCERLPKPDFNYYPTDNTEAGDTIWFFNESARAQSYQWEFGDNETSDKENPVHIYKEPGIREVKLNAFNESGKNFISQPITIFEPTILGFEVYDDSGTRPLPSSSVWVFYANEEKDTLAESVFFGLTDDNGYVEFNNAEPIIYHVEVIKVVDKGKWTQHGSTSVLMQHKINIFTIECEWMEEN